MLPLLSAAIDFLLPPECLACEAPLAPGEQTLCLGCLHGEARFANTHPLDNDVAVKLWGRLPLSFGGALFRFQDEGPVQRLLHTLKYRQTPRACKAIGVDMGKALTHAGAANLFDGVCYVPLHSRRARKRGYNQAERLAAGLSAASGVPLLHALAKTRYTKTQTRLGRADRWHNLAGSFALRVPERTLTGKRILLVDDVLTTGATLEQAAQPLLAAGVASIGVMVVADVPLG